MYWQSPHQLLGKEMEMICHRAALILLEGVGGGKGGGSLRNYLRVTFFWSRNTPWSTSSPLKLARLGGQWFTLE